MRAGARNDELKRNGSDGFSHHKISGWQERNEVKGVNEKGARERAADNII